MNKKEMLKKKTARQQEMINLAKSQQRDLSAEEQAEFDALQREIEQLKAEIEEEERNLQGDGSSNATRGIEDAITEERNRIATINALGRDFGMDVSKYVERGSSVEETRSAVLEYLKNSSSPISASAKVTNDEGDKFRAAATDALIMRSGMSLDKPAEGARELMSMSLRDMAIESLQAQGETGLNRRSTDEIFQLLSRQYYNPTSAFPAILDNAINKAYVEGHKTVAVTFDKWTKKGSLKDFKTSDNNYLAGPAGEFLEVPEGGELKHDVFSDAKKPTRKLRTYGRQFTLTRQAFINDDIDLVTRIPAKYAASARKTINKQVYQILCNNPAIYDGAQLFSNTHKNVLASGTGITQQSLQKMILALQTQTDEFGEATIIRPATLIVPSGMGFEIFTIFNSPTINTSGNTQAVNPLFQYASSIEIVEEPTINVLCGGFGNTMPWFLIANRDDSDFIEVDYLNGQEVPIIRRMENSGTLGFVWDIYLDWGISVMDYRGAVKNPGAVVTNPLA